MRLGSAGDHDGAPTKRPPRVRPAGLHAVLAEFDDAADVHRYYLEAQRQAAAGLSEPAVEIVPGAQTILFDQVEDPARLARELQKWQPAPQGSVMGRQIEIPTRYDGPDLAEVAQLWAVSIAQLIQLHAGLTHVVAFHGFAPGFAYLQGLPAHLAVPRRSSPRTRVPAGAVGLAGRYTGVYPRACPGGWQLIGQTDTRLWDASADPPALLLPGDRVRFVPVAE